MLSNVRKPANLRKRFGKYSFVQFKAALPPSEVNSWVIMMVVVFRLTSELKWYSA